MNRGDQDEEKGSITPLVPIIILAFLLLGGLVIDASRDLNARSDAQAYAEEAARAGAGGIDLESADLALSRTDVETRVGTYCAAVMQSNSLVQSCKLDRSQGVDGISSARTCGGKLADIVVNTIVTIQIKTTLLGLVHIEDLSNTVRAKARPYQGVTADTAC